MSDLSSMPQRGLRLSSLSQWSKELWRGWRFKAPRDFAAPCWEGYLFAVRLWARCKAESVGEATISVVIVVLHVTATLSRTDILVLRMLCTEILCTKILYRNFISEFYIGILYWNFISEFYILNFIRNFIFGILYQNFISEFYINILCWILCWTFM